MSVNGADFSVDTGVVPTACQIHLVAQFQHHPFGSLLADPGNAGEPLDIAAANRVGQISRGQPRQTQLLPAWADAADADEFLEQYLLLCCNKSEKRDGVLANMGVHLEGDFLAVFRQGRIRRNRDRDIIANTVNIDDDLVRVFFEQRSSQAGNHTAIIISALE